MAGGKSERLWPFSRKALPKQFLSIADDGETMIQKTVFRLLPLIPCDDIYVVTNEAYLSIAQKQLPMLPMENILIEPMARNTAPCVAYATAILNEKYGDAIMIVLASDHLIGQEEVYLNTLREAAAFAEANRALVTIGMQPTYPEVGYGYIEYDASSSVTDGMYPVKKFVEKPNLALAFSYCAAGNYLWNSGMFVWRLSVITQQFQALMPSTYAGMREMQEAYRNGCLDALLSDIFSTLEATSIDYGIMEHAEAIYTKLGTFLWMDVGNWNALPQITPPDETGNLLRGDVVALDVRDTIALSTGKRLIALIGLEDMAVIDTPDALLISRRDRVGDVKTILKQLREQGRDDKL